MAGTAQGVRAAPSREKDRDELRFLTCGSVDDGKSTLIGRLINDAAGLHEDQLAALRAASRRFGTDGQEIDFALLLDGLEAEREQGITIDLAWRFFATARRAFVVADTPGHPQYTRNMATGASNCELAVLLVDARKGLLEQTRRHAAIVSLLGIRHVVVAVNKIDLVRYSEDRFREIEAEFTALAKSFAFTSVVSIPVSARLGDNVARPSRQMPWYAGPTLLDHLETVDANGGTGKPAMPLRFPVQWINRPHADFRGFAGTVASGRAAVGDRVVVARSGMVSTVARIVSFDGDLREAVAGRSVTLTLADEIDIIRGDVLADPADRPVVTRRFAGDLVWMDETTAEPGRQVLLKTGTATVPATISRVVDALDIGSLQRTPAGALELNGIGGVWIETPQHVAFDRYEENRATGSFILIDRLTLSTVAAGMVTGSLDQATNVHHQPEDVTPAMRAAQKAQRALVVWLTGLPGAGKSTIANLLERKLAALGRHTMLLDGDNLRQGLNTDIGFEAAARTENVRRIGEVAKLMADAGLIVIVALISPFRADRARAAALLPPGRFLEVFVDTPPALCRERDVKGLYRKAEAGKVANVTGRDQPYEAPQAPGLVLRTAEMTAESAAELLAREVLARV